jgi:hypothetical protein
VDLPIAERACRHSRPSEDPASRLVIGRGLSRSCHVVLMPRCEPVATAVGQDDRVVGPWAGVGLNVLLRTGARLCCAAFKRSAGSDAAEAKHEDRRSEASAAAICPRDIATATWPRPIADRSATASARAPGGRTIATCARLRRLIAGKPEKPAIPTARPASQNAHTAAVAKPATRTPSALRPLSSTNTCASRPLVRQAAGASGRVAVESSFIGRNLMYSFISAR